MKYALFICVEEGVEPSGQEGQSIPESVEAWATEMEGCGVRIGG